jgi:hypothetical protein
MHSTVRRTLGVLGALALVFAWFNALVFVEFIILFSGAHAERRYQPWYTAAALIVLALWVVPTALYLWRRVRKGKR